MLLTIAVPITLVAAMSEIACLKELMSGPKSPLCA